MQLLNGAMYILFTGLLGRELNVAKRISGFRMTSYVIIPGRIIRQQPCAQVVREAVNTYLVNGIKANRVQLSYSQTSSQACRGCGEFIKPPHRAD